MFFEIDWMKSIISVLNFYIDSFISILVYMLINWMTFSMPKNNYDFKFIFFKSRV